MTAEQFAIVEATIKTAVNATLCELKAELRKQTLPYRTLNEAAEYLRCTPRTVLTMVEQGSLEREYIGGKPIFRVVNLDKQVTKTNTRPRHRISPKQTTKPPGQAPGVPIPIKPAVPPVRPAVGVITRMHQPKI